MTTFHEIDLTCPVCQTVFTGKLLTSTNTFGPRSTDFHQRAAGFQPLPLLINTCPNCGYSGASDDFEGVEITPEVQQRIWEELSPIVQNNAVDPAMGYAFSARIIEWQGGETMAIAHAYLQAAWCCDDIGNEDDIDDYRLAAIDYFKVALDNGEAGEQTPVIAYLIGELYRRAGLSWEAHEWFTRVIEQAQTDPAWQQMAELAQQQRDDPQDYFSR